MLFIKKLESIHLFLLPYILKQLFDETIVSLNSTTYVQCTIVHTYTYIQCKNVKMIHQAPHLTSSQEMFFILKLNIH